MDLRIIEQPAVEPITLEDARLHLRLDAFGSPPSHPDDDLIASLLAASREYAEQFTGRTIAAATYEYRLDAFPSSQIELPRAPVTELLSVTYLDESNLRQTVDPLTYELDDNQTDPVVELMTGESWPTGTKVRIQFIAGYSAAETSPPTAVLPFAIRAAMLLMLGHLYESREAVVIGTISSILPMSVESLLRPYRIRLGMA